MRASTSPTCGNEPTGAGDRLGQRQDLAVTWLYPDRPTPSSSWSNACTVSHAKPTNVAAILCELCGDGRLLVW
jgi:hypothetical protein